MCISLIYFFPFAVMGKTGFRRLRFSGEEYMIVASTTSEAPTTNENVGRKAKRSAEMMQEMMILKELAKTLRTLSAYLTTTATMRPPTA
jgi:hypothetical protein